jgi:AcrR family transcriptional regulator
VLDAARRLFADRGYSATTVQDIAAAARVATATVYTSVGGKPQLLQELITATTDEAAQRGASEPVAPDTNQHQVLAGYVAGIRQAVQDYGDVAELLLTTTHVDANAARTAVLAEQAFRSELTALATRLRSLGPLTEEIDAAVDLLAYYLGYPSWRRLTVDLGWSLDRAQDWLTERLTGALITTRPAEP